MSKCKTCKTPCPTKKSKKTKKKAKDNLREPSYSWWTHEDYVKRRTNWLWRLRPFLVENSEQCSTCTWKARCHRVPLNEDITSKIANGKSCPDYKSMWKKILGDDEEHDWGF